MPALENPASPATATTTSCIIHFILGGLGDGGGQGWEDGYVLEKICGQVMTLGQVFARVVADPDLGFLIFPDQDFERQIDGDAGRRQHEGRASLRISED